jgi:hypothetical protein
MPLEKGSSRTVISKNISEMSKTHPHKQAVAAALRSAHEPQRRADGGGTPWFVRREATAERNPMAISGPLTGATMGRADKINTHVPDGSHILPADTVSAIGGGNSMAGHAKLGQMFPNSVLKPAKPITPKLPQAPKMKFARGGATKKVPVRLSDGEFSVHPDDVVKVGGGDPERGHRILDHMILHIRKHYAHKLTTLPGPAKD